MENDNVSCNGMLDGSIGMEFEDNATVTLSVTEPLHIQIQMLCNTPTVTVFFTAQRRPPSSLTGTAPLIPFHSTTFKLNHFFLLHLSSSIRRFFHPICITISSTNLTALIFWRYLSLHSFIITHY